LGVLRFNEQSKKAELASYHPGRSPEEIVQNTGWNLRFAADLRETPPPTREEISILRRLDPEGFWLRPSG
jgi:glutaconate CoA-transferase subunit B